MGPLGALCMVVWAMVMGNFDLLAAGVLGPLGPLGRLGNVGVGRERGAWSVRRGVLCVESSTSGWGVEGFGVGTG